MVGWRRQAPRGDCAMPDALLRKQARAAIRAGKLPEWRPDHTWSGPGVGAVCAVCDRPVTADELGLEIDFSAQPGSDGRGAGRTAQVHVRCFAAWRLERPPESTAEDVIS